MITLIVGMACVAVFLLVLGTAPITSLTGTISSAFSWNALQTQTNGTPSLTPIKNNSQNLAQQTFTVTDDTVANAMNQVASKLYSIAVGVPLTIDLSAAIRNVVNDATATFVRIKGIQIRLLSTAQGGTAASSITVGNAAADMWVSQAGSGWLNEPTGLDVNGSLIDIPNGGFLAFGVDNANGVAIDGTHKNLLITNNDGAFAASVEVTLFGADA